jgi:hypothetical protein
VAGDALAGALNEQLNPSALRPALLAAKAALDALMQHINSTAAAISMINLMAGFPSCCRNIAALTGIYITEVPWSAGGESARYLHKNHAALHRWNSARVLLPVQGAYHSV